METINLESPEKLRIENKLKNISSCLEQTKLYHETKHAWDFVWNAYLGEEHEALSKLTPMLHYEDFCREKYSDMIKCAEEIIKISDPEQIKKYNELIDKFNSELDDIKETENFSSLKNFHKQATDIIKENKIK